MENVSSLSAPVLAVGELLWDILPTGAVLGGAPANFAVRLAALGTSASIVSRIGSDELGNRALAELAPRNVGLDLIQRDPIHPTGTVPVELTAEGNPRFTILPNVAYDFLEITDGIRRAAGQAKLVYFGTLIQRSPMARETLYSILEDSPRAVHLVDINLRKECYTRETIERSLKYANIAKLNNQEMHLIGEMFNGPSNSDESFGRWFVEYFDLDLAIITVGPDGALSVTKSGEVSHAPGLRVRVVDTIGAGDAFTAGFVHQFLRGKPPAECCYYGNAVGALTAAKQGGMPVYSTSEVDQFMAVSGKE